MIIGLCLLVVVFAVDLLALVKGLTYFDTYVPRRAPGSQSGPPWQMSYAYWAILLCLVIVLLVTAYAAFTLLKNSYLGRGAWITLCSVVLVCAVVVVICGVYMSSYEEPQREGYRLSFYIHDGKYVRCSDESTDDPDDYLLRVGEEYSLNIDISAPYNPPNHPLLSESRLIYDESVLEIIYADSGDEPPSFMGAKIKLLAPVENTVIRFESLFGNRSAEITVSSVD